MSAANSRIKILFASGSDAVIARTLEQFAKIFPEWPLVVVAEFPPEEGEWIPYHIRRRWRENLALIRSRIGGREIGLGAMILEPRTPHWPMRRLAIRLAGWKLLAFNETGQHFRMRPDNLPSMLRNLLWRTRNLIRSQMHPGGRLHDTGAMLRDPEQRRLWALYWLARAKPWMPGSEAPAAPWEKRDLKPGISVVIPSRNGRDLLARCLPRLEGADEIVVVDNGSSDGTAEELRRAFPHVTVDVSAEPLSFAGAANRGLRLARFSHVCLLNNDMLVEPGFLKTLRRSFDRVPDLFAATAQIFFPEGQRREETGKAVWTPGIAATDFPVRYEEPLAGEDETCVLYGSGGCTLFDAAKLAQLGGFDPVYEPAYVEDLDLGLRAWRRGWPSVYCAGARVLHQHRATTSRYFTAEQLGSILERNFAGFLARQGYREIWRDNLKRLRAQGRREAMRAAAASRAKLLPRPGFLDLLASDVANFPGRARSGKPVVMIASPYLPFPLAHGGAVRIYNLMRRAARDFDQVLVSFVEKLAPAPRELTELCLEVVTVRRPGTHALPSSPYPDTVEEFRSPAYREALRQAIAKYRPAIAQLEFTQMAQYADACQPARTLLVEHDITCQLYEQELARREDWETRYQYERWVPFESAAWRNVDRVITMSEQDRRVLPGSAVIPNGVDLERFRPAEQTPEPNRLLFVGSFAHHPNVLALEFFLREVFPRLPGVALHVIAGQRHESFWDLKHPGVEVQGFVADVRPAYARAAVVIAPLVVSAGTNLKIMEAMAMGKAIVTTEAGVHGLEIEAGAEAIVASAPEEMAEAILHLLASPDARQALERRARRAAESRYGWDAAALEQKRLYDSLIYDSLTEAGTRPSS